MSSNLGKVNAKKKLSKRGRKFDVVFKRDDLSDLGVIAFKCFCDDANFKKQRVDLIRALTNYSLYDAFVKVPQQYLPISDFINGNYSANDFVQTKMNWRNFQL